MAQKLEFVCAGCEAVVAVPRDRAGDAPRCPRCHQPILRGEPLALTGRTFDRHLGRTGVPFVVDFWASWCAPCRIMAPVFATAAREREPEFRFGKVDTEAAPEVASRFGIRSIPTLIAFRNGREVARQAGALDQASLNRWLDRIRENA